MQERKRFIAGAKCPACQQMDRLFVFRRAGVQYRECAACSFQEEMRLEPVFRELETRVNQTDQDKRDQVSLVRLVDPKYDKDQVNK